MTYQTNKHDYTQHSIISGKKRESSLMRAIYLRVSTIHQLLFCVSFDE